MFFVKHQAQTILLPIISKMQKSQSLQYFQVNQVQTSQNTFRAHFTNTQISQTQGLQRLHLFGMLLMMQPIR